MLEYFDQAEVIVWFGKSDCMVWYSLGSSMMHSSTYNIFPNFSTHGTEITLPRPSDQIRLEIFKTHRHVFRPS